MTYRSEPLGDIATIEREGIAPKSIPSGARYVGLEHIDSTGALQDVLVENGELASTKFSFTPEHILFGKLRPYLRKIARPEFSGICSTDIIPIKPSANVDRGYLFHFLRLDEIVNKATSLATGINLPRLSPRILETFDVPLPPLDEQRRIAAILDQADDLRRKRRATFDSLERLGWATFYKNFGTQENNPKGFDVASFGSLITDGPTNGLYKPASAYGEGTRILRINNFYDGIIDEPNSFRRLHLSPAEIKSYGLRQNDIVINRVNSREYLGKSALIPELDEATVFESNMMRLRINLTRLDPVYCISFLQTDFIKRQIAKRTKDAVNQSSINQSDVRSFSFLVPPLDLQRDFAVQIAEINKLKACCRAHLTKLDTLFASLQHRAFGGEL